jgi:hypothetical protein
MGFTLKRSWMLLNFAPIQARFKGQSRCPCGVDLFITNEWLGEPREEMFNTEEDNQ